MTATLKSMLEYEEGRRNKPYKCSENHWTIGVGHKMSIKEQALYNGITIPDYVVGKWFVNDIAEATKAAQKYTWFKTLNEPRQAVIISMIFQMGSGRPNDPERKGFLYWTDTHKHIAAGDFVGASTAMLDSVWAKQTPNRAKRHAEQFKTGIWCDEYIGKN